MSEESQTPIQESVKKERTPAQIDALNRARIKAHEVRSQNKSLRDKQKEIDKTAMEEIKRAKVEKIEKEYSAIKQQPKEPVSEPPPEDEEEEEVVYQKKEKKAKKKRIVVVQASSDSDSEEVEVRLPKKKREKETPKNSPKFDAAEYQYRRAYNKMFGL